MTYKRFLGAATAALTMTVILILAPGSWAQNYKTLHAFTGNSDGGNPQDGLIIDPAGNLYGTTYFGGYGGGFGTVFELTPAAGGGWTESVLFNFTGENGWRPVSGLTFDAAGNLYGTTF